MFRLRDRQKCLELLDKYYAGRKFNDARYIDLIKKHLRPGQRLLDAGCGRYLNFCKEFSGSARVVGIDLEPTLETNNQSEPFGVRGDLSHLPFPSNYFDIVISRYVIEHLEDPSLVFREFSRVLRSGGKVVILTPNKYDYVSVVAALTPYRVHRFLASRIFQTSEDDFFPTLYRANTLRSIRHALESAGLMESELETINHYPAYLMFSPLLFRLGVLYERLTSLKAFRNLRGSILCAFVKGGRPHVTAAAGRRPDPERAEMLKGSALEVR
jgi:ubiquinone/menaquinone biosynthesis C-methylase UbiE